MQVGCGEQNLLGLSQIIQQVGAALDIEFGHDLVK
jgi:hypothetical protein